MGVKDSAYGLFYDEAKDQWSCPKDYNRKANRFHVRGAAYYVPDNKNPDENKLNGYLMLFYVKIDKHIIEQYSRLAFQAEYLGVWIEQEFTKKPWTDDDVDWDLYPVVGVIDPPPFVLNDQLSGTLNNKTTIHLQHASEETDKTDWELKAGFYQKYSQEIGINEEIHIGITYGEQKSKSVTTTIDYEMGMNYFYKYDTNKSNYKQCVLVVYLAPTTKVTPYYFYRPNEEKHSGELYVVEITEVSLLTKKIYVDEENKRFNNLLPRHPLKEPTGNLESYPLPKYGNIEDYWEAFLKNAGDWESGEKTTLGFDIQDKKENKIGGYLKITLGANMSKSLGFGFEGEFGIEWTRTTTIKNSIEVHCLNPSPRNNMDIERFTVTLFWGFEPKKNTENTEDSWFWIPSNRKNSGDRPWFITFYVNEIKNKDDSHREIL